MNDGVSNVGDTHLVVFSASWCNPCQVLKNRLVESGVKFTEIDADTFPEVLVRYGVRSLPTVMAYSKSREDLVFVEDRNMETLRKYAEEGWDD